MKIRITPEARRELKVAADYYESKLLGLGAEFIEEYSVIYEHIKMQPQAGIQIEGNIRFRILRRFPYTIFYTESDKKILILAVAHQKRLPGYWRERKG